MEADADLNGLPYTIKYLEMQAEVVVAIEDLPGEASLCITNSGRNIAPEVLPRLFDRFFRVDKSRSHPESDGTGLGLSITQAIMTAHSGSVSVTSALGKTTFCLAFRSTRVV